MTIHADLYAAKTGVRLHPGTLNEVLDWHVSGDLIRLGPPDYAVPLNTVPCSVAGVEVEIEVADG